MLPVEDYTADFILRWVEHSHGNRTTTVREKVRLKLQQAQVRVYNQGAG